MGWNCEGLDESNRVTFTAWRCGNCKRRIITTGDVPRDPCPCSERKMKVRR